MDMILNFHYDLGHGWLETTTSQLAQLGIYDKISEFSYIDLYNPLEDGSHACYLEEDCDANIFVKACKDQGISVTFIEIDGGERSYIRSLRRFAGVRQ
jgi:hypothetical protein